MPRQTSAVRWAAATLPLLCLAACSSVSTPARHSDIVGNELAEIIAIKGAPCGAVLEYSLDDRLDYRVRCASGHVYRIQVTSEGHVQATSQPTPQKP
jgi:hypothetical protein